MLKPASDYGGHGVSLGMETPQAEWDRLIEEHVGQGDYVVQEYVPVPEEMFPAVEDGHVQMRLKRFNINPFGLGGRYAGMITRISDQGGDQRVRRRRPLAERGGPAQRTATGRGGEREMRPLGYDVDDNASRFSNYFHVLRELVHFTNGWMPLEPSFERKYTLGDHVHDDARALTKIKRRLYELRHPSEYPGSPSPELERLLDRMAQRPTSAQEYLAVAYTEAKPALVRAMRIHLDNLDPVADEPSLRLLTQIVERQERHTDGHGGFDADIGALPVRLREQPRALAHSRRRSTNPRATTSWRSPRRATRTSHASCT